MYRLIIYILFLLCSLQAYAQVEMEIYVEDKVTYKIGQEIPIVFIATFESSHEIQMKLPYFDPKKCDVFIQESSKDYYLDDRSVALTRFSALIVVRPKVAGPLKIGSALAKVDNIIYKTDVKDLFVKNEKYVEYKSQIRSNNEVYIRMEVNDNEVYVNQATMAIVTAYSKNMNSLDNIEDIQFPSIQGVKYYKVENSSGEISEIDEEYSMKISVYLVFPEKSGKITLPPVSAKVVQGGNITQVKSNSINLNVKPLPEAVPSGFQNAVGEYDIKVSMKKPIDIEVNKPVSVQVKLSGVGNLKDVKFPKFVNSEYYSVYKPKINYNVNFAGQKGFKGQVTATYIILPKKPGKLLIELESFSYFDLETKKYKQVALSKLPLFVQMVEQNKSTVEKVMENTASVLNQKISVIPQINTDNSFFVKNSSDNIPTWILFLSFAFIAFFIYFFCKVYNSNSNTALPTQKNYSPHFKEMIDLERSKKIRTNKKNVNIPIYLRSLENLINQKDFLSFFTLYANMNRELEQEIKDYYNMNLLDYIKDTLGSTELEVFKDMQRRIEILKFSPFREEDSMKSLLQQVRSIYEKIEK